MTSDEFLAAVHGIDWDGVLAAARGRHLALADDVTKHAPGGLLDGTPIDCCGICLEQAVLAARP